MSGPFDSGDYNKEGTLPRHIERMNMGTRPPKMKQSGDGNNLPWGGQPKEQQKAYSSGLPKNKGSMLSKTGERGTKGTSTKPQNNGKAMQGFPLSPKSKAQSMGKKK